MGTRLTVDIYVCGWAVDMRLGSAYTYNTGKWTHMRLGSGCIYEAGEQIFMRLAVDRRLAVNMSLGSG